ncbi:MAG: PEP-CTERM sorting domain-containing protein [Planctomycetota bacterium]
MNHLTLAALTATAAAGLTTGSVAASVLNLDFGPGVAYLGDNTPANAAGAVAGPQAFLAVNGDTTVSAFGTSVGIDLGRNGNASSGTVSLTTSVTPETDNGGSGIFATDLTNDSLASFSIASGTDRSPIGLELSGLPAGDYRAFVVPFFGTYINEAADVYAGVAAAGDTAFSDNDLSQIDFLFGNSVSTTDWIAGDNDGFRVPDGDVSSSVDADNVGANYVVFDFTIDGTDSLYLLVEDFTNNAARDTVISSLQIVDVAAIPEPASFVGLAMLGLCGLRRRRA